MVVRTDALVYVTRACMKKNLRFEKKKCRSYNSLRHGITIAVATVLLRYSFVEKYFEKIKR